MLPEVWYAIPSANLEALVGSLPRWYEHGYKIAILIDKYTEADLIKSGIREMIHMLIIKSKYEGHSSSVNELCFRILAQYPQTNVIVTAGDDMFPDTFKNAQQCQELFMGAFPSTFGVLQPIGDRFGNVHHICGSPFMGRSFIKRINQGTGPFWHEYYHFYNDQEMHDVCERLGILWKCQTLEHYHDHWSRKKQQRPSYLDEAQRRHKQMYEIYTERKKNNFPGHEPLPEESCPNYS